MPEFLPLQPVALDQLIRVTGLPAVKQLRSDFPKRAAASATEAKAAMRRWIEAQPAPKPPVVQDQPVQAFAPSRAVFSSLRAVVESETAPAEILKQKMNAAQFSGSLYSAVTTYEYMLLEAEHKKRSRGASPPAKVETEWAQVQRAAQQAFAAGGLKGVNADDLAVFSRELAANSKNLNAVVKVAQSAVAAGAASVLDARTIASGTFVPFVDRAIDLATILTSIPDLCSKPISEGSFTKHFARSFALQVRLRVWCPTWTNPFRTCVKTFTIAGVSFSIGLNVGYRVTCCGATAWGQAYAQACGTIIGITVCAGCSATITGVAGVSRTPVSGGCSYGVGINAVLECKLFGIPVFYASVPFGWTITGPCPPAGLCA